MGGQGKVDPGTRGRWIQEPGSISNRRWRQLAVGADPGHMPRLPRPLNCKWIPYGPASHALGGGGGLYV